MKNQLYLAVKYVFRGKAKHISFISIVSILGIAMGVLALIVVISVMNGFDRDLMEKLLRFNYHIVIEVSSEENIAKIKELKKELGIKSTSVFLQSQVLTKIDNYIVPLIARGIDFSNQEEYKIFSKYILEEKSKDGIFIGDGLRKKFLIFDNLEIYPLDNMFFPSKEKIRGVFKIGLYDIDNNYIITDIQKIKNITKDYLLFIGLRIDRPFSANIIKEKIKQKFQEGIFVTTWIESNKILFSALKLEKIVMFIILSLIILVASFNIFATLTVKTVEKTKDIGILKSIGYSNRDILSIFTFQGLILGIIGVLVGSIVGLGLCFILKKYPFIKLPEEIYYIEYLPVAINYRDIFLIAFIGILLSFISSIFPALYAANLSPTEAIRYE